MISDGIAAGLKPYKEKEERERLDNLLQSSDKLKDVPEVFRRQYRLEKEEDLDNMLTKINMEGRPLAVCAAGALMKYLDETQKLDMGHIRSIEFLSEEKFMELDWATRRSLELTEAQRTGEKRGSLLWVLDKTRTPMGGRMLRSWIERPLRSPVAIKKRLSAVDELVKDNVTRGELIEAMRGIGDMQRLIGRVVYGTVYAASVAMADGWRATIRSF